MIVLLKDAIDSILYYAEAVPPTKTKIFRMDEKMQEWLKTRADAAAFMLNWKLQKQLSLTQGAPHEVPNNPAPAPDAGGVR